MSIIDLALVRRAGLSRMSKGRSLCDLSAFKYTLAPRNGMQARAVNE